MAQLTETTAEQTDEACDASTATDAADDTWYTRAYNAFHGTDADQREFVRTFIDVFIRNEFANNRASVQVQDGLTYSPDAEEVVDDWTTMIDTFGLKPSPASFGFETFVLEASARTYDTAQLSEIHENPAMVSPSYESTVWVYCDLGFRAQIDQLVAADTTCKIYAPEAMNQTLGHD